MGLAVRGGVGRGRCGLSLAHDADQIAAAVVAQLGGEGDGAEARAGHAAEAARDVVPWRKYYVLS